MTNGDFVFDLRKVRRGEFQPERSLPPGANTPQSTHAQPTIPPS